jgi:hypothetical protein
VLPDAGSTHAWQMQTKRTWTEKIPSGMMERKKNHSPPKNKLVQDSEGNEENGSPDPNSNKTKIDYPKEPNEAHKNTLKEQILQEINENFMEMVLPRSTKIYRRHSRNSKTINKEYEETQKKLVNS